MSNKTPKVGAVKTVSARNKRFIFVVSVLTFVLVLTAIFARQSSSLLLEIRGKQYTYETAKDPATQARGLSGRLSLANNHAMLFEFDTSDKHCFWMKDMFFSLDIIWLDEQKRVVYTQENLSPETYPNSYCPPESARYVVEVKAGTVAEAGLKLGDHINF